MTKRFIEPDGFPDGLELLEDGRPYIEPDRVGALKLLIASALDQSQDGLSRELEKILRDRPALPLLSGLISVGLTLASVVYGEGECAARLSMVLLDHELKEQAADEA